MPHFFAGLKVSGGLALIGAVAAEFVAGMGGTASGLVTGGAAKTQGSMSISDARWKQTFDFMTGAKPVKPGVDYNEGYTLEVVEGIKVLP